MSTSEWNLWNFETVLRDVHKFLVTMGESPLLLPLPMAPNSFGHCPGPTHGRMVTSYQRLLGGPAVLMLPNRALSRPPWFRRLNVHSSDATQSHRPLKKTVKARAAYDDKVRSRRVFVQGSVQRLPLHKTKEYRESYTRMTFHKLHQLLNYSRLRRGNGISSYNQPAASAQGRVMNVSAITLDEFLLIINSSCGYDTAFI
ncbi:hypothetical protein F4809DRAFT_640738 [Biscogniauxia mediterranea]|nr:hypothetical protein F4809DRAFT_640738 [Biscogniauxia mediterranea]